MNVAKSHSHLKGRAYVGPSAPSFVSQAVNFTCRLPYIVGKIRALTDTVSQTDDDTEFIATPERTMDWPAEPTLFIDMTEGTNNPVGFVKGNETLENGSTISGFGLYGGWAFHKNGEGSIEMNFLATPTNETDIYLYVSLTLLGKISTDQK